MPIMTEVALMTARASLPDSRPSSATALLEMVETENPPRTLRRTILFTVPFYDDVSP